MGTPINRYTQLSNPRFDPMSLQELMMAPSYKRGQHDKMSESMAETEAQLAKVDPLDYHSEVAQKEQQRLYDQLSSQADLLTKEGFTNTTKSDVQRINKDYQQSISPTGIIGKINAAKKVYNENFKSYMEDATKNKKWSREDALRNWQQFESEKYTGFDDKGGISNIGQFGAPEKIELMSKLKDVKSILGSQVVKELGAGNYSFSRQPDGSLAIVNKSGRRIETSNAPNIQNAMGMLNSELSDPNSAWNQSIKFEGLDPSKYVDQIQSGLEAMLTNKVTDNRSQSLNFKGVKNTKDITNPNIPSVTEPVVEYNANRDKLQNLVSKLGKPKPSDMYDYIPNTKTLNTGEIWTENDFSESQLKRYNTIFDAMKRDGNIDINAEKFSEETNKAINQFLEDTSTFSFSNKILKPNAIDNELQKPLVFSPKKGEDMERHLQQEIFSGRRSLIDKDTQEAVSKESLQGAKFDYVGMVSPDNVLERANDTSVFNNDTFVLPHVVQATLSDGTVKEYYMDRDAEEMKKPEFKASKIIKNVLFNGKVAANSSTIYSSPDLLSKGISNVVTKYNSNTDTYNIKIQADNGDSFILKDASSANVQKSIYRLFTSKQN